MFLFKGTFQMVMQLLKWPRSVELLQADATRFNDHQSFNLYNRKSVGPPFIFDKALCLCNCHKVK